MSHFVMFGASRGLGEVFHRFSPESGDQVWLVSRSQPVLHLEDQIERVWIEADLAAKGASQVVSSAIAAEGIDTVIYNVGIWETSAFTEQYKFEDVTDEENERILNINLVTAISCIKALLPNLRLSQNPKIILVGFVGSHDYVSGREVAYAASNLGYGELPMRSGKDCVRRRLALLCLILEYLAQFDFTKTKWRLNQLKDLMA